MATVTMRREGGRIYPAVNVKVYHYDGPSAQPAEDAGEDAAKFADWLDQQSDHEREFWWRCAVENGWDRIQECATDRFGPGVAVYSAGRSGGWAIVEGLPDPNGEDAEVYDEFPLKAWEAFETDCAAIVKDLAYQVGDLFYFNAYVPEVEALERSRVFGFYYDVASGVTP